MEKNYNSTIISAVATFIGFIVMINQWYIIDMPTFGIDLSNANLIEKLLAVIVLGIIWLVIAFIMIMIALYGIFGWIITPIIFYKDWKGQETLFSKKISKINRRFSDNSSGSDYRSSSNSIHNQQESSTNKKTLLAPGKKGQIIDQETGRFKTETGPFFTKSDDRVDLETGKYKHETIFGIEIDSGKKIDIETGEMYEDDLLGYQKTGTRINQDTGRIEEDGLFGWEKTNDRINPETGKREEQDWLGIWSEKDDD